jgi:hypothetical protein
VLGTAVLVAGLGCSRTVDVEMQEGKTTIAPASVSWVRYIKFRVANTGTNRHHFIVVETNLGADKLPVDGGRVRKCSYSGEPHLTFYGDHGGWSVGCRPGYGLDPEDASDLRSEIRRSGVTVAPGEVKMFDRVGQWDAPFSSGTSFIVYCDEAGHYERGEYAALRVE